MKTNQKSTALLRLILAATMATPLIAASAPFTIDLKAIDEKKDATLTIEGAMVSKMFGADEVNGFLGTTNHFKGKPLKVMAVFADKISDADKAMLMRAGMGFGGTVQCKRVRVGDSAQMAIMKTFVLAEGCSMIKLQNR